MLFGVILIVSCANFRRSSQCLCVTGKINLMLIILVAVPKHVIPMDRYNAWLILQAKVCTFFKSIKLFTVRI